MPRRAHGRPLLKAGPSKPIKRKPRRNAALNALETAERQNPDTVRIRQHRLGEVEDDSDSPVTKDDVDERSSKRRKIANADEEEQDEDIEEGSDFEGGRWHTGVNDDDEDSDLDSDEAFGESDEERFADFTFRGSSRGERGNVSQNEGDDSQQEDDLGDGAVDLATAWDMDDDDQENKQKTKPRRSTRTTNQHGSGSDAQGTDETSSDDSDAGDSESEKDELQLSISDDESDGDTAALRNFVEGLSSSRANATHQLQPRNPKALGNIQPMKSSSKLSAADLLQYVKDPAQRQSIKILQSAERSGPENYAGGIPGRLSAPLAKRQQDRLDRAAAYDKSKETLNRWIDTVKQNRRAEHLSFPLLDSAKASAAGQKRLVPLSQTAPLTNLESTINQIMQESGMEHANSSTTEDQEQAFEGLSEKKMDIEDVRAKRAELRIARELMFREEIRAKRIKKIKSKAFRRVHRKERDKIEAQQREALAAAGLLDSDNEREENDRKRAEERMGARHRESKWAKAVKQTGRSVWDEDARVGVTDAARRDEELRRRVSGRDLQVSDASDVESDSETDYDTDTGGRTIASKLNALERSADTESQSKLNQMAFMRRAEAARKAKNDEEIRQLLLAVDDTTNGRLGSEDEYQEPAGRQKFGVQSSQSKAKKATKTERNEFEARISDDERDDSHEASQSNLDEVEAKIPLLRATGRHVSAEKAGGSQHQITRQKPSKGFKPAEISSAIKQSSKAETALNGFTSPSESEDDRTHEANGDDMKAALAASIFAGPDDTVREFDKEKKEVVKEEGDQVIDNTLPGWGNWTGAGVSKREQKRGKGRFLTRVQGVAPEKRKDAKLERVIINEKRVKKNGKYLATELPHPFETLQQYERSLRLPVGPEWSTANHYQDSIKPRVLLKQGTVIRPIAKPIA